MNRSLLDLKVFGAVENRIRKALTKKPSRKKICFFPYIGGKFHLLKTLIPLIPPHEVYVEVFGGAANLLLNKPPSKVEVYNDIDGELINLFMVVRDSPDEFVERFQLLLYSRELYYRWVREEKKGLWPEDPVERAARFYFVMRSSFSGTYDKGWSFRKRRNPAKFFFSSLKKISLIAERLKHVQVDHLDFRGCIKYWDEPVAFFFLDPPYYGLQYYRMKFSQEDHEDLREILGKTKGKWLLTYNDDPWVRDAYAEFNITEAQMIKAASHKRTGEKRGKFTNLIITNYQLPTQKALQ